MAIYTKEPNETVYYYAKAGILAGIINCVVGQEDHILSEEELNNDPYKKELYKDTLLFIGTTPLMAGYPLEDKSKPGYVRLATRVELINMGKDKLNEGEKIVGDEVVEVPKPNEFAKWDAVGFVWTTDFESLTDGWKITDRDTQKLEYISSPNYHAKWDKVAGEWKTDVADLLDGEKLLPDGKIENVERPIDDNQHKYEWNKGTFTWDNVITQEELKANYFKIIEKHKADCINAGFMFRGYQQKCRMLDMNWITQRMNQTRDDALAKDQIDLKYQLIPPHKKEELTKVGWVFDHNEVLMLDILDFKEMFDMGAKFSEAAYLVEEVLKDGTINFNLTLNGYRALVEKYSKVPVYMGPVDNGVDSTPDNDSMRPMPIMLFRAMPGEPIDYEQEGKDNNPAHKLGLRGSEVMLAAHYGISLEEAAAKKHIMTLEEKQ